MQSLDRNAWTSAIDEALAPIERSVLQTYRFPSASDLRRQIRLSAQYAIGTGLFLYLSLSTGNPLYGVVVYVVFFLWMVARLFRASRITGAMPRIIEKYEARLAALQSELARVRADVDGSR
ncbi:MAG TPA: hypothetical protein VG826_00100 [Pirellulales bacterium]|nr:hypothetical protein [Pirellulales bacterium]